MRLRTLSSLGNLPHPAQRIARLLFKKSRLLGMEKCRLHPDETIQHIVYFMYDYNRIMRGACSDCAQIYEMSYVVDTIIFDLEA